MQKCRIDVWLMPIRWPLVPGSLYRKLLEECYYSLIRWGRVTHIWVNKLTIIGSDNGLPPGPRQAIIWTNAGISLIGPLGKKFCEILIES